VISLDAAPTIKHIKLPRTWRGKPASLRRSWLVGALSQVVPDVSFIDLLREFCPQQWRALPARERTQMQCYATLLNHLPFPILPYAYDYFTQWNSGYNDSDYWWWDGVPINVQGFDDEGGYIDSQPLSVQMIWYMACSVVIDVQAGVRVRMRLKDEEIHKRAPDALKAFGAPALVACVREGMPEVRSWLLDPPAGGKWRRPWGDLNTLVRWVTNDTGYGWLDETTLYLEECDCYPPWNADEIRALIENWNVCAPILTDIGNCAAFIDAGGKDRLMLMSRVIHGDLDAIEQVTE
jgi:hypothetical protein